MKGGGGREGERERIEGREDEEGRKRIDGRERGEKEEREDGRQKAAEREVNCFISKDCGTFCRPHLPTIRQVVQSYILLSVSAHHPIRLMILRGGNYLLEMSGYLG